MSIAVVLFVCALAEPAARLTAAAAKMLRRFELLICVFIILLHATWSASILIVAHVDGTLFSFASLLASRELLDLVSQDIACSRPQTSQECNNSSRRADRHPGSLKVMLLIEETNFAGGKIIDAADQADLMLVQHLSQDRAALANLLHDESHVGLSNFVHKFQIL